MEIQKNNKSYPHEITGSKFLETYFIKGITEPIRLHVKAKRYLYTMKKEEIEKLSQKLQREFVLQGGFMDETEMKEYKKEEFFDDSIDLRNIEEECFFLDKQNKFNDYYNFEYFEPYFHNDILYHSTPFHEEIIN
jgi:predicted HD phosphohydrolase